MNWKFWQKNETAATGPKLPRPKELSNAVGRYLVVNLKHDPDWVWRLKGVSKPRENSKVEFDIRIFDETIAAARGVMVKNYTSLDDHPDLVIFEGWYDKEDWKMEIRETEAAASRPTAA